MDVEFRPCPSFPGYSASQCGLVRRESFITASQQQRAAKIMRPNGRGGKWVRLYRDGRQIAVSIDVMVRDAWAFAGIVPEPRRYNKGPKRPASSYPDGRVLTLAEYREHLRASVSIG